MRAVLTEALTPPMNHDVPHAAPRALWALQGRQGDGLGSRRWELHHAALAGGLEPHFVVDADHGVALGTRLPRFPLRASGQRQPLCPLAQAIRERRPE